MRAKTSKNEREQATLATLGTVATLDILATVLALHMLVRYAARARTGYLSICNQSFHVQYAVNVMQI